MSASISQEEENGIRLHLLIDKCTDGLRDYFHRFYSSAPVTLYNQLRAKRHVLTLLKKQKFLNPRQWSLLFPSTKQTDSSLFDISLLYILLRHICIIAPQSYWACDPSSTDCSDAASITRIKNRRNNISHDTLKIDDISFQTFWSDLSGSLLVLSPSKSKEIKEVQTCALDIKLTNKLHSMMAINSQLTTDISNLKNRLKGVWWNVLPNVANFSGRLEDAHRLYEKMASGNSNSVVVTGLGGVGKTELAKYYCKQYGSSVHGGNVMWMDATDSSALSSSFVNLAKYLEISIEAASSSINILVPKVYDFFCDRPSLFVFDNYAKFSELRDYLPSFPPHAFKPCILITTQYKTCIANFEEIHLEVFSVENAKNFIISNLQYHTYGETWLKGLSDLTGNLPLALQQAIAYINRHTITIEKYIDLFKRNSEKVLGNPSNDVFYKHTVLTAWRMALNKLKEANNKQAVEIMFLMSYMDGKCIEYDIFMSMDNMDELELNEAIDILSSYCVVSKRREREVTMHSLVQHVVRQTVPPDTPLQLIRLLQKQINESDSGKCTFGDVWLDHALSILYNSPMNRQLFDQFVSMRTNIERGLLNRGKYRLCQHLFLTLLEKAKPFLHASDQQISYDIRTNICKAMQYSGLYADAREQFETLVKEMEYASSMDLDTHVDDIDMDYDDSDVYDLKAFLNQYDGLPQGNGLLVDANKRNIALCLLHQGEYNQCMALLENIRCNMTTNIFRENYASVCGIDYILGVCLLRKCKYKKSLTLFEDIYKNIASTNTNLGSFRSVMKDVGLVPDKATVRSSIGKCMYKLKKYEQALKIFKEVEQERVNTLGEDHPITLQDKCNTATCIAQKFDFKEGLQSLRDIEEKQRNIFDQSFTPLAVTHYNIAIVEQKSHPHILVTQYNIAKTLLKNGKADEALEVYKPLYEEQCNVFGGKHPRVMATLRDMERCSNRFKSSRRFSNKSIDSNPLFMEYSGDNH